MLSEEQIGPIKESLISQLEQTDLPNKEEIKNSISQMNATQLEEFLKQNNIQISEKPESGQGQQCVFCSIVFGDIPSTKINENEKAIAILEINPISKGHILIIPKEHVSTKEKLSKEVNSLAEKISKQIKEALKPKEVIISNSNLFGHEIVNVIPVYENETPESPRHKANPEELKEVQELLEEKPEPEKIEPPKTQEITDTSWLPKRIP